MADNDLKLDVKWAIALLLVSLLAFSAALAKTHAPPLDWWTGYDDASYPRDGAENVTTLTGQFLSNDPASPYAGADGTRQGMPLVVPFEVLSVIIVAALIGAVAVAFREPEQREQDRRWR